jgi:dynein heavy chain, axonemal
MAGNGTPAEFFPIGDWVREHSVFNIMKQLPFFRNFMARRFFCKWRASARQSAFGKVRLQE